jgi:hypothetical protein
VNSCKETDGDKMRIAPKLLLALAMFAPALQAQAKCPWINEATAVGILGGPVAVTTKISEQGNGVCEFSWQQGAVLRQLNVSVNVMTDIPKQFPTYLSQCPPKSTPLRAIGNEAVVCSVRGKGDQYEEKVVGRVRDKAFVVGVSSNVPDDQSMTQETRRKKANLVAEQVAGILF